MLGTVRGKGLCDVEKCVSSPDHVWLVSALESRSALSGVSFAWGFLENQNNKLTCGVLFVSFSFNVLVNNLYLLLIYPSYMTEYGLPRLVLPELALV